MICETDRRAKNLNQLVSFRKQAYDALSHWPDTLFELADSLTSCPTPTYSTPALSLEPEFRRSHGSLYKALEHGVVDLDQMRKVLVEHKPSDWPDVYAVDATSWARNDAETSPERGYYYSTSKQLGDKPIVAGWQYQLITQLNWEANSWTAPVDQIRLKPGQDPTEASIRQVKELVLRLSESNQVPMFVFDAGYDSITIGDQLKDEPAQIIVRLSPRRIFYSDPGPELRPGRPRRHGKCFKLSDSSTWHEPDKEHTTLDGTFGRVVVQAWNQLHPRLARRGPRKDLKTLPIIQGTIVRIQVEHLPKSVVSRDAELWLWWSGPGKPDLDLCWRAYLRRFDIEHTIRFLKHTLGWSIPSIQTPQQADTWTWLVVVAYTQLRIARPIIDDVRLPWERPLGPSHRTPARVRRGFRLLRPDIGTPAHPPKTSTPGPGRPKGTTRPPRKRYPPIKAAA